MIDVTTEQPLRVLAAGTAGSYIIAPLSQLEKLKVLFDRCGLDYWVDEEAISINNRPEMVFINFGGRETTEDIQRILDGER